MCSTSLQTLHWHAGKKSNSRQFDSYGAPYGQNDIIGCLLDCDSGTIAFSKNGEDLGLAFQIPGKLQGTALYPAICLKNAELVVNFGAEGFKCGPPKGFVGLAKAPQEWVQSGESVLAKWLWQVFQLPAGGDELALRLADWSNKDWPQMLRQYSC